MKFLSWAPDPCFQQHTQHPCQEAIVVSPVPSCQHSQSWPSSSTHTLLCLGSQQPLTVVPSTQPPRPDPFSTLVPESEKLEIRSRYCLLNPSVTLDHLQNYAQTSSHRPHPNPTEVWPLLARQAPHFFSASISPSSTVPLSLVLPLLPKLKLKPRN